MNNRHLYILCAGLCLTATALFAYKILVLKYPLLPDQHSTAWDVEVAVRFTASGGPARVQVSLPHSDTRYAVLDERFISHGYGLHTRRKEGNRLAVWSVRDAAGEQRLFYRATVRPAGEVVPPVPKTPVVRDVEFVGADSVAAQALIDDVRAKSADVESFVIELLQQFYARTPAVADDNIKVLLAVARGEADRLRVISQLLAMAGIPARSVHGVRLNTLQRNAPRVHWLEVYHRGAWQVFNPYNIERGLPEDYIALWRGDDAYVNVTGGTHVTYEIAVSESREAALLGAMWREQQAQPLLFEFSLLGLPLQTQAVYHLLLTVPLGVLLLIVMRNIVGIKTFGTFMPVLIALAFRETQLFAGIFMFVLIVGTGLLIRFYLEQLKLLLVPRLASVLIVVIILMVFVSIIGHKMGMERGLSIALFPIVILTMTIERMSIVWEERGAREALQQGFGSLLVASLAYLVMNIAFLQHLVFIFPELLLLVLACALLLGRYSGYRLTELWRFRVLGKD